MPMGFSIAQGILARVNHLKNSTASFCSGCLPAHQRAPLMQRYVQGGKAIIMSNRDESTSKILPKICGPGFRLGRISQEMAECPRRLNSSRTVPVTSQATKTLSRGLEFITEVFLSLGLSPCSRFGFSLGLVAGMAKALQTR